MIDHATTLIDPNNQPLAADGIAELRFDSTEALQAGFGSPEGQAALSHTANLLDMTKSGLVLVEDHVVI